MNWPIQTQSQQYDVFDDGYHFARDHAATTDLPEGLAGMLSGPRITAGMLNTREAVDTSGMDPESHAYHEFRPQGYGHRNSWGTWELDNPDYSAYEEAGQGIEDDDASGYNWGPAPPHDPGAEPGPHPDFSGGAPHPMGTPVYNPRSGPHNSYAGRRSSFRTARRHSAEGGPAPSLFTPMLHTPGERLDWRSQLYGGEKAPLNDAPVSQATDWVTAQQKESFGTMPQQQAVPMLPGHGYAPGHRIGLPYQDQVIPGTVTHLDGQEVGVRWDDGQHSTEAPADLRPL